MSITEYLRALYWFLEPVPFHTVIKQSRIAEKTYRQLCYQLRTMMFEKMQEVQGTLPLLGGRGKAVCIDETYFTKKKRCRGGWVGHVTLGHKTVVLGMCEIDLASRRCTGNVRLIVLQGCTGTPSAALLRKHIEEHVLDGFLILLFLCSRISSCHEKVTFTGRLTTNARSFQEQKSCMERK